MTDRHQGHSALPYRPAPSCFIHKNRACSNSGQLFFFFFLPSWAPDGVWAPVQLLRYLGHWSECMRSPSLSLAYSHLTHTSCTALFLKGLCHSYNTGKSILLNKKQSFASRTFNIEEKCTVIVLNRIRQQRSDPSGSSCVSMKSDHSQGQHVDFRHGQKSAEQT